MKIAASVMSDREETVVDKQVSTTGVAPPPPPAPVAPPPQVAVLIVQSAPTPTPATPPPARELPHTGSLFRRWDCSA
jgi:hypothetical protein